MRRLARIRTICLLVLLTALATRVVLAVESPTSYGPAARVDTPILRIPLMTKPPKIDGVIEPGEWEDSSSLSGFWYDFSLSDFRFLAPMQTQLRLYAGYDKEHLYFCFSSPVYPEDSWLKARGRFPDVLSHPLYGMLWDDHHELELRPCSDMTKGFQLGLLRFDVNPIGSVTDWYWSQKTGHDWKWKANAVIRSVADGKRWIVEYAIPLKSLVYESYRGNDEKGQPLVTLPPPDGTIYRAWFTRSIGGCGAFFNAFDNHIWNTCKTELIFDSQAPSFQVNELGPIMEDTIDLRLTIKNHNTRSETVRLGFFVESAEGLVYSSYDAADLKDGLLELRPGEVRRLRLQQPFPGISRDGNVLWFDVRSAGRPAKTLFLTRLIQFHSMDGGVVKEQSFMDRRVRIIAEGDPERGIPPLRPARQPFDLRVQFSPYTKRLAAFIDKGIDGASEDAKRAVEAKLTIMKDNQDEDEVEQLKVPFKGNFACFVLDLPKLVEGESYKVGVLLFDEDQRIVGEKTEEPFQFSIPEWQGNKLGLDDVVWEPFVPIQTSDNGIETLKHRVTLATSGLPAQFEIKTDPRDLPLEKRAPDAALTPADLLVLGRGPQFRAPMRLEAVIDGKRVTAEVKKSAKAVRTWKSEIEYTSKLQIGAIPVDLTTRYDCDGSMHCTLTYGSKKPVKVDSFELVVDIAGQVDLVLSETGNGAMTGADRWECSLTNGVGVVWDSSLTHMDLFYNKFVPWFWFGSADRAWSWYCDSSEGWVLDREGSTMQLERDKNGDVTWRVQFVNHPAEIKGRKTIAFTVLTHPAKPKPEEYRKAAWHYLAGTSWAEGYIVEPFDLPEATLLKNWRRAASAPKDTPESERTTFRKDKPPFHRYGWWRNVQMATPELDQTWEDKATWIFEKRIRIGRRVGWWMDEYFPVAFGRSENVAAGNAHFRNPEDIEGDELPWHSQFLTTFMRDHYKRLARIFAKNNVPQLQHTWSGNGSNMLEPFLWNSLLVEECGAGCRAYEIDLITQFPNSLYRVMGKNYAGLVTTICADVSDATAGDDKRIDRQRTGISLLHDFGTTPNGPHGTHYHKEQGIRLLTVLTDFGFFKDAGIEKIPFWRNADFVRIGDKPSDESQVYVTVYRRALENGKGYKAIFVILNESSKPVEMPLSIVDSKRIFGGSNSLRTGDILGKTDVPAFLKGAWDAQVKASAGQIAFKDLETGEAVARVAGDAEIYGPVYVPYHDYRILYGHFEAP
ncbi:MAG: hypothetical protein HQ559_06520 [Lentisphaerae bacterium]|nr:hypothetical protein [Lentisphaerota bacterium]